MEIRKLYLVFSISYLVLGDVFYLGLLYNRVWCIIFTKYIVEIVYESLYIVNKNHLSDVLQHTV